MKTGNHPHWAAPLSTDRILSVEGQDGRPASVRVVFLLIPSVPKGSGSVLETAIRQPEDTGACTHMYKHTHVCPAHAYTPTHTTLTCMQHTRTHTSTCTHRCCKHTSFRHFCFRFSHSGDYFRLKKVKTEGNSWSVCTQVHACAPTLRNPQKTLTEELTHPLPLTLRERESMALSHHRSGRGGSTVRCHCQLSAGSRHEAQTLCTHRASEISRGSCPGVRSPREWVDGWRRAPRLSPTASGRRASGTHLPKQAECTG